MIAEVLSTPELSSGPPVLVDIGASGALHPKWNDIAPCSKCIAFDADSREMGTIHKSSSHYRQLQIYHGIVTAGSKSKVDFYLTRSPFCSSTLQPDGESLAPWQFSDLFEVQQKVEVKATTLTSLLAELRIDHIDWIKIDSQGTDIRLFQSLESHLTSKVPVAEFEPGILDAYRGEDKLYTTMSVMDALPFWLSSLRTQGTRRLNGRTMGRKYGPQVLDILDRGIPVSPEWAELNYFNSFPPELDWKKRDIVLAWVFAVVERQYGFALELIELGMRSYEEPLFNGMERYTLDAASRTARDARIRSLPNAVFRRMESALVRK